jgi:hypothetical protein
VNGILWKLRTGSPWRDLPERYGPSQTCFDRYNRWRRDGTWDRLLDHVQTKNDAVEEVEWEVNVDDTVIRAHKHAAVARSEPSVADEKGLLNSKDLARRRRQHPWDDPPPTASYKACLKQQGSRVIFASIGGAIYSE